MAFTDLTVANGWIPVDYANDVLLKDAQRSVVEQVGRIERMTTDQRKVLRFEDQGVDVVPEGTQIPQNNPALDNVLLDTVKFANIYKFSSEDQEDQIADAMAQARARWTSNFAVKFDNACLGVTGTGGPYESVYRAVGAGNRTATAGELTYEDLVSTFGALEQNQHGSLIAIAHPSLKMDLRSLKDEDGNFVVDTDGRLGAGVPTIFGHELQFSFGARTHATATDKPTGNPLLVVANRSNFIVGVRSGPEAQVSPHLDFDYDTVALRMRARRAFVLATADAARVIEKTSI